MLPATHVTHNKVELEQVSNSEHQKSHPALLQSDILKAIFEHFDPGSDSEDTKTYKAHLYAAALVCKAFLDPALDSLWRSMTTLLPLLKLLPVLKHMNGTYIIYDEIHDDHWSHMDSYGRRVREFIVGAHEPSISLNTYLDLIHLRNSPLLPNLCRLRLRSPNPSLNPRFISDATMVLSSSLESLEISEVDLYQAHIIQPFLLMLAFKAPRLRRLIVHGAGNFWATIKRFSSLSFLSVSKPITFRQVLEISALPQLKHLTINVPEPLSRVFAPSLPPPGFPQLHSLTITARMPVVSCVIECVSSDRLQDLHIITRTGKDPVPGLSQWSTFLLKVDRKWGREIHSLSIEQETSLSLSDLPDLSAYKFRLQRLSLRGWTVSDAQLEKLVAPFPNIEELRLTGGCPFHKALTLSGLRTLAKVCTQLGLLQAPLEAGVFDTVDDEVMSHGLKKFIVTSWNTVPDTAILARQLDQLFPRVVVEPSQDVLDKKGWRGVNRLLSIFREIRRDERIRRGGAW